ncbi:transcriptional regulator, TetR family [Longilinea arvoryzae]|uniref:Transcriptional regulator, TetR family n=2 Tax=Longilinea arvoryzae TaxID=360412 RepID=A0A0S7B6Q8_9CHLR|nr:transcriptional regulator, TetR family [Longilinea arvoryzae]
MCGMDNQSILLQVALELFAARGYDGVGVQEIAEAAGVTKPTLYHYFGSKAGLLTALLDEQHEPLNRAVAGAAGYHGDLPGALEALARAYFDFARAHPAFYRMQLGMYFAPRESEAWQQVAGRNEQQYQAVAHLFASAVGDHGNLSGRQELFAAIFIGSLNNCIALWLNGRVDLNDELVYRVVRQFQYGIYSG